MLVASAATRGLNGIIWGALRRCIDGGPNLRSEPRRPTPHHVGLDISVKETTISVVDELANIPHRAVVASDPAILVKHLLGLGFTYIRIGLEAGG